MPRRFKGSTSVDLDKVEEVAMVNPKNAILMLVTYLKIKREEKEMKCPNCRGKGWYWERLSGYLGKVKCGRCNGTGRITK